MGNISLQPEPELLFVNAAGKLPGADTTVYYAYGRGASRILGGRTMSCIGPNAATLCDLDKT